MLLRYLPVPPQPLPVVVEHPVRAEHFGHGAFGLAVVAHHLFQAIFGLCITRAERRSRRGFREDVGYPVLIAQNLDLFGGSRQAKGEEQDGNSFHGE